MNWKTIAIFPIAALALQGCGGDPDALNAASGQVSSTQATALVNTLKNGLGAINISFNAPAINAPSGGGPGAASIYDGCTTVNPNPRVDADGDGIAASKVYTYDCAGIVDSGMTYNLIGSESFTDKDDTKSIQAGGYSTAYDYVFSYSGGGRTNINTRKGSFDLAPSATGFTYTHVYSDDINDTGGTNGQAVYKQRNSWSAAYTPTDMANPANGGTVVVSGFYSMKGWSTWAGSAWADTDVTWEVASTGLTYQTGCAFYKSGTVLFLDGAGNRLTWEYGCTGVTIRFNGTQVATL